jgi:pSer/pThr/pTyr-binding forkhead associated (FHA) protein
MDLFLQACGARGPLQMRLECPGGAGGECLSFDTPCVVIGRDPGSDLVLDHKDVCDRHAYLQWIGGRLYCVDLGSRGGISLGGQNHRAGWVEPRRALRIGPYRIRLVADEGASPSAPLDLDLPGPTLDLVHRGFRTSECRIAGGIALVGSSTDCQVRLLDPGVSGVHCSLLSTPMGAWVVDLLAKGGIQVNGEPVRHTLLHEGDVLQVGRSTIRLRHEAEAVPRRLPSAPDPFPDPGWALNGPTAPSSRSYDVNNVEATEVLSSRERRASCRYPVADVDALLSWWEPIAVSSVFPSSSKGESKPSSAEETIYARVMARWPGSPSSTAASRASDMLARDPMRPVEETMKSCVVGARVLDLSQTGLQVLSKTVPPAGTQLWLRLESPQITEWVEVVLKGAADEAPGTHRVRLAFRDTCPYDLFKVAVYGRPGS